MSFCDLSKSISCYSFFSTTSASVFVSDIYHTYTTDVSFFLFQGGNKFVFLFSETTNIPDGYCNDLLKICWKENPERLSHRSSNSVQFKATSDCYNRLANAIVHRIPVPEFVCSEILFVYLYDVRGVLWFLQGWCGYNILRIPPVGVRRLKRSPMWAF